MSARWLASKDVAKCLPNEKDCNSGKHSKIKEALRCPASPCQEAPNNNYQREASARSTAYFAKTFQHDITVFRATLLS